MAKVALPRVAAILDDRAERIAARPRRGRSKMRTKPRPPATAYEKSLAEARGRAKAIAQETRDELAAETTPSARRSRRNSRQARRRRGGDQARTAEAMANVRGIAADTAAAIVERLTGQASRPARVEAATRPRPGAPRGDRRCCTKPNSGSPSRSSSSSRSSGRSAASRRSRGPRSARQAHPGRTRRGQAPARGGRRGARRLPAPARGGRARGRDDRRAAPARRPSARRGGAPAHGGFRRPPHRGRRGQDRPGRGAGDRRRSAPPRPTRRSEVSETILRERMTGDAAQSLLDRSLGEVRTKLHRKKPLPGETPDQPSVSCAMRLLSRVTSASSSRMRCFVAASVWRPASLTADTPSKRTPISPRRAYWAR